MCVVKRAILCKPKTHHLPNHFNMNNNEQRTTNDDSRKSEQKKNANSTNVRQNQTEMFVVCVDIPYHLLTASDFLFSFFVFSFFFWICREFCGGEFEIWENIKSSGKLCEIPWWIRISQFLKSIYNDAIGTHNFAEIQKWHFLAVVSIRSIAINSFTICFEFDFKEKLNFEAKRKTYFFFLVYFWPMDVCCCWCCCCLVV